MKIAQRLEPTLSQQLWNAPHATLWVVDASIMPVTENLHPCVSARAELYVLIMHATTDAPTVPITGHLLPSLNTGRDANVLGVHPLNCP